MLEKLKCGPKCLAINLLCVLLLSGLLLSGCQNVDDTSADTEAGRQAEQTAVSPDMTHMTDKNGNIVTVTTVPDVQGDVQKGNTKKAEATATTIGNLGTMNLKVGDKSFTVKLENNATAKALKEQLPLTLNMEELNGNEKYYYYSKLPTSATRPGTIHAGDVMLYQNNYLVIFYQTHKSDYSYTRIGSITDTSGLAEALGSGNVTVEWSNG